MPHLGKPHLPSTACFKGIEVFAGSKLHTLTATPEEWVGGQLRLSHTSSLQRLTQLRELRIDLFLYGDPDINLGQAVDDAALPGTEDDASLRAELHLDTVEALSALRRLVISPPAGLQSVSIWCGSKACIGMQTAMMP
ncbi:hypothetical protein HYH02_000582 [Chlamydomonas schloesseri]|uniref:Uncharacterized protein n=1 Tax=Chlamydomonas schloesseri TaxID=2026947 RepID=A0A836BCR6_9CHLO|nr:hypothetical protein HYH02_000582 [Chlamydomonas schloesseri]|eukprot:KAG2454747.1 hypothetical protein HYH02_000582 [Chlamydomonas schloesseri]